MTRSRSPRIDLLAVACRHGRRGRVGLRAASIAAALAFGMLSTAMAADFRSVLAPAVMYDAPSRQASRLFLAPRGMPVEVVSSSGAWLKVRDISGDFAWVERTDLGERRSVIASGLTTVRQQPQDGALELFQVERGVLLELARPSAAQNTAGWLEVRHRDAGTGWVRTAEVWGW